jgi:hypothetical protein
MMGDLAFLGWSVVATVLDAAVGVALPASRTTPDGTVVDDGVADAGATAAEPGGAVEMAQRFLFDIPDEVKTGLMLVLAAAIGVYLYINFTRDRP